MAAQSLTEFLDVAGAKPYRQLVEHHIRRQSTDQISAGLRGEIELLPTSLQAYVETFIDVVNARIGYDRIFWSGASCREAAEAISDIASQVIPTENLLSAFESTLREGRADLSFGIFQIATLNFAYSASFQPKQRKFMGIRKGLFR